LKQLIFIIIFIIIKIIVFIYLTIIIKYILNIFIYRNLTLNKLSGPIPEFFGDLTELRKV